MSRWDLLPDDLTDLVRRHGAASSIQAAWLRWDLWSHARKEGWGEVRSALALAGKGKERILSLSSHARREWRTEGNSWRGISAEVVACICAEAEEGLWGPLTTRLFS